MNQWRKYGSIAVCFWSLLLVLVGISQLIFGAYFISKLPIFKIGSPVWVGFLNILGATGLFALHHKRLELKSLLWRLHDIPKTTSKKGTSSEASFSPTIEVDDDLEPTLSLPCSRRLNPLHWSLALCLIILVINVTNVLLCEVGEWHHWVRTRERPALLSPLAIQAHRVTAAQMSLAVLFGLTCTAINVWLIYKERMSKHQHIQPDPVVLESIEPVPSIERPRSKTLGFDNPNWVYGHQQQQAVLQQRQQQDVQVHPELAMVEMENGSGPMRYATIRRAAPISSHIQSVGLSMDQRYPPTARLGKSASFRVDLEQHQRRNRPTAGIHRSKTMRETSFTTNEDGGGYNNKNSNNTFANRFQPGRPDGPSALGFVHDALTIMEDDPPSGESPPPTPPPDEKEESTVHQPPTPPPPPRLPVVRHNIRSSDRIVLRVESFRGVESKGRPLRSIARNQNVKRVSSSTQTDLSVLMKNSSALITMQRNNTNNRRPNSSQKFTGSPIAISEIPASNEITESTTTTNDAGQQVQLSPVESSSGYSSPRGTDDSKSSSPEPASLQNPQQSGSSTISSGNVTIIQIEPQPVEIQEPTRMVEATYATPRKRSERSNSAAGMMPTTKTPPPPSVFRVSIQPQQQLGKPLAVSRSVSFHHMSQSDRRSVYNHEWLHHPSSRVEDDTNNVPMISIPRPALRMVPRYVSPSPTSSSSSTHGRRRHPSGSSLNRSTSVYLAMSEIQRKLDVLQLLSNSSTPNGTTPRPIVPVHNQQQQSSDQDYSYYNSTAAQRPGSSSSSGRTRRVSSSSSKLDWNNDPLDSSAKTLAYLSELEQLARHWRTQLLYKVELKTAGSSTNRKTGIKNTVESSDTFQC